LPLSKGDRAPQVSVRGVSSDVSLPYQDRATVIFFYPTNMGRTCVTEVVDFERRLDGFRSLGAEVVGVTTEPLSDTVALKDGKQLSLTLCSDSLGRASELYGVRNAYGFADRFTFLISRDGLVLCVWQAYDTVGHAEDVLSYCRRMPLG